MKRNNLFAVAIAGLVFSTLASAAGQNSTNYAIPKDTINAGVGDMASTNFRLSSSVGDAVAGGQITSVSFRLSNGFRAQISASPAALNLLSVVSQKIHGSATYKLTIDHHQAITGAVTVEPRAIGGGHTLVFHFDSTVGSVTPAATALNNMISVGTATAAVDPNGDVVVTLTNVADNKRLTVTINGLNGSGTATASMGFLVGDVNNDRVVSSKDVSAMKARTGQTTDISNFVFDLNATGVINASDVSGVKARANSVPLPQ
jgi:hypothetical protein